MEKYTIYQIVCKNVNVTETYIGSTKNLKIRIRKHKDCCINPNSPNHNLKVYKFIRANGGWNNFKFVILETKECKDEYDAHQIEQQYINSMKSELNDRSPYTGLTKEEYKKQYKILNKEKIKERTKQYYQENKEYIKQYYQENKNKLNEKYCCLICKGSYTYGHISKHEQTNKHKNYLLNLNSAIAI